MGLSDELAVDVDRAFPNFVTAHQDAVFAIALRLLGDRSVAEDVAQEAFVRAYHALCGYSPERRRELALRPWLATIVLNAGRNELRRQARHPAAELSGGEATPPRSTADTAGDATNGVALHAALARLPDHQRHAVVLHFAGGVPLRHVATALERPEGTVKSDVHRGMVTLRRLLREDHP